MTEITLVRGDATLRGNGHRHRPHRPPAPRRGRAPWRRAPLAAPLADRGLRTVAFDRGTRRQPGAGDDAARDRGGRRPRWSAVSRRPSSWSARPSAAWPPSPPWPNRGARHVAGLVLVDVVPDPDPVRTRGLARRPRPSPRPRPRRVVGGHPRTGPSLPAISGAARPPRSCSSGADHVHRSATPTSDRLLSAKPAVTVADVPDAGHLVARDAPEELARIVADQASTWLAPSRPSAAFGAAARAGAPTSLDHPGGNAARPPPPGARPHSRLVGLAKDAAGRHQPCHLRHRRVPARRSSRPPSDAGSTRSSARRQRLVHLYGACDRAPTYPDLGRQPFEVRDRFTGDTTPVHGADLVDFAVLASPTSSMSPATPVCRMRAVDEIRRLVARSRRTRPTQRPERSPTEPSHDDRSPPAGRLRRQRRALPPWTRPNPAQHKRWRAVVADRLPDGPLSLVVDAGAGTGAFLPMWEGLGARRILAVEPSAAMRAAAVDRATAIPIAAARIVAGSLDALPAATATADVVWVSTVLHHVVDRQGAFREIARVLRPRGRLLLRGFLPGSSRVPWLDHFPGAERVRPPGSRACRTSTTSPSEPGSASSTTSPSPKPCRCLRRRRSPGSPRCATPTAS